MKRDLFQVDSWKTRWETAAIAVRFRGDWFASGGIRHQLTMELPVNCEAVRMEVEARGDVD
ncbi:MAG: hypothetical protein CMJ77_14455 [Planctomycetaceae bacterium]|nr:hypothetical protein [Planctomycetaceae bacterium]